MFSNNFDLSNGSFTISFVVMIIVKWDPTNNKTKVLNVDMS